MTVVVGMSGGVDSSLSAALLKNDGYKVIGLFMKNWEETDESGICMASKEYEDVVKTCDLLQIPCYTVNFAEEYRNRVFTSFLEDLRLGNTPNPDILCNREIKFDVFFKKAMDLGADFLATGHYARLDGKKRLLKGVDPNKDQTYFLHAVKSFENVLFPVGNLSKIQVRELARKFNLPTAEKKDSTGICFIGKRDFKPFISQYIGYSPGNFQKMNGEIVGCHDGAAYYTIGQRKGLRLGGEGEAWFVIDKDISRNIVYVERGENHPSLFHNQLTASQFTWIDTPPILPFRCKAKIRYRQVEQPCTIYESSIVFDAPQRAITPGQAIVFYDQDVCLGGAKILSRASSTCPIV